ncbi:uncharacterized protein FFB20_09603 [Fusarium fujikuroi]|nr:uncharacterized protein FFE2_00223 [Fusarium fujikuroi]SCN68950.1 uncharacterized protein FFC1_00218 [Fusarium fujikuroi]SCN94084.1 uncharacterized protein FFB20_09603 [Fusarium fujikuroi]SCO28249.1 uncharacterized protein FFNC_00221 [Fusarium fujikuroi]SCV26340.1 uncharacterized protein FFFS_00221 [Fusarium fujikuroi]
MYKERFETMKRLMASHGRRLEPEWRVYTRGAARKHILVEIQIKR